MESDSKAAKRHAMNRHFPCSAMMDAGWNSTQHHCVRGETEMAALELIGEIWHEIDQMKVPFSFL